jgi:putrescine transport system substrate-binding protein
MFARLSRFAAFAVVGLAAVSAQAEDKVLNVYNWSDYIAKDTLEKFTKETGIKVKYDTYGDNEVLDNKLMTGKSGYDVVFPSASPFFAQQIKAGVFQKLDMAKIPNAGGLDKAVMKSLTVSDPGNAYGVPYMMAATGFGFNVDAIKKLAPDAPTDSWAMLFDPAVVSKLKSCGIALLDTPSEAVPAIQMFMGKDPNVQNEENLKLAMDGLQNIQVVIPKEGALVNIDVMAIPADAPHPDAAHAFINFILRPDVVAAITNETGYANAVPGSLPMVDAEMAKDPVIFPPDSVRAKMITPPLPGGKEYDRARSRAWSKFRAAKK